MMMSNDTLESYRDAILSVVHGNNHALLNEDRMSDKQKAGTALLMAAAAVGFASGLIARTDPRLKNAPANAQIDDTIELLRDTLISDAPKLSLVPALQETPEA